MTKEFFYKQLIHATVMLNESNVSDIERSNLNALILELIKIIDTHPDL